MHRVSLLFAALTVCGVFLQCQAQLHTGWTNLIIVSQIIQYLRSLRTIGSIPDNSVKGRFNVHYELTNLRVLRFPRFGLWSSLSNVTSQSANTYHWTLTNAWVEVTGNWRTWRPRRLIRYRRSGTMTARASGINLDTTVWVRGTRAFITRYSCRLNRLDLSIRGRFTFLLRLFRGAIARHVRGQLESRLCPHLRSILQTQINRLLSG